MTDNASECIRISSEQRLHTRADQPALAEISPLQKEALIRTKPVCRSANYVEGIGPVFHETNANPTSGFGRLAFGFADLLVQAPGACGRQLLDDFNNRPGQVAVTAGTSALIGMTATTLLRRSPFLAQAALGLMACGEGTRLTYGAAGYGYDLVAADTPAKYREAIARAVKTFGREGATMIEAVPGFAAGTATAYKLTPKIAPLNRLSMQVCEKFDFPARCVVPESWHWVGPGTRKIPASLQAESTGNINVKGISDLLAKAHPWRGVEESRFLNIKEMKLSRAYSGTPKGTLLVGGWNSTDAKVSFHTHPPDYRSVMPHKKNEQMPSTSIPSQVDVHNTSTPFGIINSGSRSTVFMNGKHEFYSNLCRDKTVSEVPLPMRALMFDRERKVAAIMDGAWPYYQSTNTGGPLSGRAEFLDYDKTLARLSNWNMKWDSLKEIPRLSQPPKDYHLFPDMTKDGHFTVKD